MPGIWRFVLAALLWAGGVPAFAQGDYPNRPVRIIIPYPAGASPDTIARPIARMSEVITGFAVHPSVGVTTLKDFIALAKANPGKYTFCSAGVGTITHLRGEMLKIMAGIDLLHVPYKGNGEALPDLLAGNVHAMFEAIVFPHVKAGKPTLLAVVDDERHPDFPDTPTIKESGFPDYDMPIWFGAYAPRGTPQPIIDKLHREISRIHGDAELTARLMSQGMRVYAKAESPEEMRRRIAAQTMVFAEIIRKAKVAVE